MNAVNRDGEIVDIPDFKTPYNHDTDAESDRYALTCLDETRTQQHQKDEADINEIVRRFGVTGHLPLIEMPPLLGEFEDTFDFLSAMNTLAAAKHSFAQLAPEIRASFNNDPHAFVAYCDAAVEAGDLDQLRKWNLAVPEPQPETAPKAPPAAPAGAT